MNSLKSIIIVLICFHAVVVKAQSWTIEDTSSPTGTATVFSIYVDSTLVELTTSNYILGAFYDKNGVATCIGFGPIENPIQLFEPQAPEYVQSERYFRIYDPNSNCEIVITDLVDFDPEILLMDDSRGMFALEAHISKTRTEYDFSSVCIGATVYSFPEVSSYDLSRYPDTTHYYLKNGSLQDTLPFGRIDLFNREDPSITIYLESSYCLQSDSISYTIPDSIQMIDKNEVIDNISPQRCDITGEILFKDWSNLSINEPVTILSPSNYQNIEAGSYDILLESSIECQFLIQDVIVQKEECEALSFYPSLDTPLKIEFDEVGKIINQDGSVVKTLSSEFWDGTDSFGKPVPTGVYFIMTDTEEPLSITVIQ